MNHYEYDTDRRGLTPFESAKMQEALDEHELYFKTHPDECSTVIAFLNQYEYAAKEKFYYGRTEATQNVREDHEALATAHNTQVNQIRKAAVNRIKNADKDMLKKTFKLKNHIDGYRQLLENGKGTIDQIFKLFLNVFKPSYHAQKKEDWIGPDELLFKSMPYRYKFLCDQYREQSQSKQNFIDPYQREAIEELHKLAWAKPFDKNMFLQKTVELKEKHCGESDIDDALENFLDQFLNNAQSTYLEQCFKVTSPLDKCDWIIQADDRGSGRNPSEELTLEKHLPDTDETIYDLITIVNSDKRTYNQSVIAYILVIQNHLEEMLKDVNWKNSFPVQAWCAAYYGTQGELDGLEALFSEAKKKLIGFFSDGPHHTIPDLGGNIASELMQTVNDFYTHQDSLRSLVVNISEFLNQTRFSYRMLRGRYMHTLSINDKSLRVLGLGACQGGFTESLIDTFIAARDYEKVHTVDSLFRKQIEDYYASSFAIFYKNKKWTKLFLQSFWETLVSLDYTRMQSVDMMSVDLPRFTEAERQKNKKIFSQIKDSNFQKAKTETNQEKSLNTGLDKTWTTLFQRYQQNRKFFTWESIAAQYLDSESVLGETITLMTSSAWLDDDSREILQNFKVLADFHSSLKANLCDTQYDWNTLLQQSGDGETLRYWVTEPMSFIAADYANFPALDNQSVQKAIACLQDFQKKSFFYYIDFSDLMEGDCILQGFDAEALSWCYNMMIRYDQLSELNQIIHKSPSRDQVQLDHRKLKTLESSQDIVSLLTEASQTYAQEHTKNLMLLLNLLFGEEDVVNAVFDQHADLLNSWNQYLAQIKQDKDFATYKECYNKLTDSLSNSLAQLEDMFRIHYSLFATLDNKNRLASTQSKHYLNAILDTKSFGAITKFISVMVRWEQLSFYVRSMDKDAVIMEGKYYVNESSDDILALIRPYMRKIETVHYLHLKNDVIYDQGDKKEKIYHALSNIFKPFTPDFFKALFSHVGTQLAFETAAHEPVLFVESVENISKELQSLQYLVVEKKQPAALTAIRNEQYLKDVGYIKKILKKNMRTFCSSYEKILSAQNRQPPMNAYLELFIELEQADSINFEQRLFDVFCNYFKLYADQRSNQDNCVYLEQINQYKGHRSCMPYNSFLLNNDLSDIEKKISFNGSVFKEFIPIVFEQGITCFLKMKSFRTTFDNYTATSSQQERIGYLLLSAKFYQYPIFFTISQLPDFFSKQDIQYFFEAAFQQEKKLQTAEQGGYLFGICLKSFKAMAETYGAKKYFISQLSLIEASIFKTCRPVLSKLQNLTEIDEALCDASSDILNFTFFDATYYALGSNFCAAIQFFIPYEPFTTEQKCILEMIACGIQSNEDDMALETVATKILHCYVAALNDGEMLTLDALLTEICGQDRYQEITATYRQRRKQADAIMTIFKIIKHYESSPSTENISDFSFLKSEQQFNPWMQEKVTQYCMSYKKCSQSSSRRSDLCLELQAHIKIHSSDLNNFYDMCFNYIKRLCQERFHLSGTQVVERKDQEEYKKNRLPRALLEIVDSYIFFAPRNDKDVAELYKIFLRFHKEQNTHFVFFDITALPSLSEWGSRHVARMILQTAQQGAPSSGQDEREMLCKQLIQKSLKGSCLRNKSSNDYLDQIRNQLSISKGETSEKKEMRALWLRCFFQELETHMLQPAKDILNFSNCKSAKSFASFVDTLNNDNNFCDAAKQYYQNICTHFECSTIAGCVDSIVDNLSQTETLGQETAFRDQITLQCMEIVKCDLSSRQKIENLAKLSWECHLMKEACHLSSESAIDKILSSYIKEHDLLDANETVLLKTLCVTKQIDPEAQYVNTEYTSSWHYYGLLLIECFKNVTNALMSFFDACSNAASTLLDYNTYADWFYAASDKAEPVPHSVHEHPPIPSTEPSVVRFSSSSGQEGTGSALQTVLTPGGSVENRTLVQKH